MSTVRRVFFYLLALITLGILAAGLRNLLSLSFDTIASSVKLFSVGDIKGQLSLGIALLIIGCPLWLVFWGIIQRQVKAHPEETGSAMRAFSLTVIIVAAAMTAIFALSSVLAWLLGGCDPGRLRPGDFATLIVAAAVWYYHWRIAEREGHPIPISRTLRNLYVYLFAAMGLVWLSASLIMLANTAFLTFPIWPQEIVRGSFWNGETQSNISWALVGLLVWAFHWMYMGNWDLGSSLRQVYFYLFAVLCGAVAGLTALTQTIYKIVFWLSGGGHDEQAYFQFLGWTVPAMLVAGAIWFYHLRMAEEEALYIQDRRLSARRVHYYLMSFLGLGTLVAGLIILLGIPVDAIMRNLRPETVVTGPAWWTNELSLGLALLAVSVPIWLAYWSRIIAMVEKGGLAERGARSRRTYLFGVTGIAVVTLAFDLVNIIYQILNGILTGKAGVSVLSDMKWSLQTVFIAVPVLLYHLAAIRQDQRLGSEKALSRKNITVMLYDKNSPELTFIQNKLGYKVRCMQYGGEPPAIPTQRSEEELERLATEIGTSEANDIMVILLDGEAKVLPYKE
ncbi:MAG: DUF5671 domain-containing protein [Dehalococcoidia bacterium]